jgi:alkylation response protein AidB-like acyl-CoA dehydrogenase
VRDGDEWIVNGQKVWTSLAHLAKWGMLLARTDPDVPKHKGMTYFVVDMQAPGVTVRPLVQITGDAEFNEVFFDDVRIPDSMRLGPEGDGWRVAVTTLMNERVSLSGAGSVSGDTIGGSPVGRLIERHRGITDAGARQRLAQAYIESRLIRLNNERAGAKRKSGAEAGPEGSITKLMSAEFNQRLQKLAVDLQGIGGVAWEGGEARHERRRGRPTWLDDGDDRGTLARGFLRAQANTIEGGTSDIMRNILGERVLGLPKEPDQSRDTPWKDVPRSA